MTFKIIKCFLLVGIIGSIWLATTACSRASLAFTLGTGIGTPHLQARIDTIERKAIAAQSLTPQERIFLDDFYHTLAWGGKSTVILRETGGLMFHYLDGNGEDYQIKAHVFKENKLVQRNMRHLRRLVEHHQCPKGRTFSTAPFYMPHRSQKDSIFGLYWGTLHVTSTPVGARRCKLEWRAEVPWHWPSYETLRRRHGSAWSERFPIPNAKSILRGKAYSLFVGNGLGGHLVSLGMATPFKGYGTWEEALRLK